ncbi:MAG: hypothetical protein CFE43_21380 [Burkholderiales bacterium PBB3]|nr:MAG: hypothetical protein CFE43_21380 [Burkholderiales bacterium PBB3]
MPFALFVLGIAYAFFALSVSAFGVGGKEVAALHADIRGEIARGGAMGLACRFIQPLIWLLALPMEKLSLSLALAGCLICFGMVL